MAWDCPKCARRFRRAGQSHECSPAMSLAEYFSTGHVREREIYEVVVANLEGVGPVHVEPVSVGIFLKRSQSFAELRPMRKWVAISFSLPRAATHRLITRKVNRWGGSYWHVANVPTAADVDDQLLGLLAEAYLNSPD
jgi:uncharacterized protein DUF5655